MAMESEFKIWPTSDLIKFAEKFQKIQDLCNISWFYGGRPPLEQKHAPALLELASSLGEPADARRMERRVHDFIANMLHLMRDAAEGSAPEEPPPDLVRLATRLDLGVVASAIATGAGRPGGAVDAARVESFAAGLAKAARRAVAQSESADAALLLRSAAAVEAFAREIDADVGAVLQIWLRLCDETRRELGRAGREPTLSPVEWRVADLLLLHEPTLPLLERDGEPVCPERALRFLVRLVVAAATRLARLEGEDPAIGVGRAGPALEYGEWVRSVWTAVHIAYCKRERAVSSVLLQRRWHELRLAARERPTGGGSAGELLRRLLPNAGQPPPWPVLVRRGLVVDLTTLGCRDPDLLCLLDDVGADLPTSKSAAPNVDRNDAEGSSDAASDADTVRLLQAIDPRHAEVSIVFDPPSDSEAGDSPAPPPAPAEDSLSFIIKQALNCRSVARLTTPRLRELTEDILQKNSAPREGPAELARRHGVAERDAAWWARNGRVARLCRPVRVRLARLRRAAPRVALPDLPAVRRANRALLTAHVAPSPSRRLSYLQPHVLRFMAGNAQKYLEAASWAPGEPQREDGPEGRGEESGSSSGEPAPRGSPECIVLESDSGDESPRPGERSAGILDDELSDLRRSQGAAPDRGEPSCFFKLPAGRHVSATEYAAAEGAAPALLRADLLKPLWLVSREFVPLTTARLAAARPSLWGSLPGAARRSLVRVLLPDEADAAAERLVGDPPRPVPVYDVVQDVATFRRLNASGSSLLLFSLRTGTIGHLVVGESAPAAPVPAAGPVVSSVFSLCSVKTVPAAVPQAAPPAEPSKEAPCPMWTLPMVVTISSPQPGPPWLAKATSSERAPSPRPR